LLVKVFSFACLPSSTTEKGESEVAKNQLVSSRFAIFPMSAIFVKAATTSDIPSF
jgi:hypothetical protein